MKKIFLLIILVCFSNIYSQKLVFDNTKKIILSDSTGSLKLKITAFDQINGIEYAFITLQNINIKYTTDQNGELIINNLKPGKYSITISALGYPRSFDSLFVYSKKITERQIYLPSEEEKYEIQAYQDIQAGKIQILLGGLQTFCTSFEEVNNIAKKYGFQYKLMGCGFFAGKKYNEKMYDYLNKRNGENWYEIFKNELDDYCEKHSN